MCTHRLQGRHGASCGWKGCTWSVNLEQIFIGPKSEHCLALSVSQTRSHSITHVCEFCSRFWSWIHPASPCIIQGVFYNRPPLEFAKCWPVSNWFWKNVRVPDCPPPHDQKMSKCVAKWIWFQHLEKLGGASPSNTFHGLSSPMSPIHQKLLSFLYWKIPFSLSCELWSSGGVVTKQSNKATA